MTVNDLIERLQTLPIEERQRDVLIEINESGGGYVSIQNEITRNTRCDDGSLATALVTEWQGPPFRP